MIEVGKTYKYSYDEHPTNRSAAIVEVVEMLSDEVAVVKFHKVLCDQTGNGYFKYLQRSGHTMNVTASRLKQL